MTTTPKAVEPSPDTSARDELAAVIVTAYGEDPSECPCTQDFEVAAHILAAGYGKLPVIHDVDWALDVLQKCGIRTADQFDALVTLQKLIPHEATK